MISRTFSVALLRLALAEARIMRYEFEVRREVATETVLMMPTSVPFSVTMTELTSKGLSSVIDRVVVDLDRRVGLLVGGFESRRCKVAIGKKRSDSSLSRSQSIDIS